jgi:hypothetical protein
VAEAATQESERSSGGKTTCGATGQNRPVLAREKPGHLTVKITFNVALPGARMKLVVGDSGLYERED